MRLIRKRLKDREITERRQVGDAESLLSTTESTSHTSSEV